MYSKTALYPKRKRATRLGGEARYWGRAKGTVDRVLLATGAIALLGLVPMLWIWLLYASGFGADVIYSGATGLCAVTVGIGFAMIRMLDGGR